MKLQIFTKTLAIIFQLQLSNLALAQTATYVSTPQNIPEGKFFAPNGHIVNKSCVHEIPNGAKLHPDTGDVTLNNIIIDHHQLCTPEQMGVKPQTSTFHSKQPPGLNGWIEYTWADATNINGLSLYNYLKAFWNVPPTPHGLGQILYFFPSFQSTDSEIVQPVLQFGYNGYGGNTYSWTLSSWYVGQSNLAHSAYINVNPDDLIIGQIIISSSNSYQIISFDNNTNETTTLDQFTTGTFNSVQGGVMEGYGITECSQIPFSEGVTFKNIEVYQAGSNIYNYNRVTPQWTVHRINPANPQCGWAVHYTQGRTSNVELFFKRTYMN